MDYNFAYVVALFFTGAASSIITTYLNNKYQVQRDIKNNENDRKVALENRAFTEKKENRSNLTRSIERVNGFLSYLEHSISLTSSVIDSSRNMTSEQFSVIYRKELVQLRILKSIIISRFPDFYNHILRIEGHHNNYWGSQTRLLKINIKENMDAYERMLKQIIEIVNNTNSEISELNNELRKLAEETNKNNTI